jgi:uncharacterized protein with PIN domain/sulfur carrier protein ThiS
MAWASIAVHGDLNDFLPPRRRGEEERRRFQGQPAVKDLLEAHGVPHPEIAIVTVNGAIVGLEHHVRDGDRVEAWSTEAAVEARLLPGDLAASSDEAIPSFVVDGHLGRLAAYLRMLGFDTWYRNDADDERLATVADTEERILLTRDRGLLKRSVVRRGAYLRSDRPTDQLVEVVRRFGLTDRWQPFGRCLRCNTMLERVGREQILDRLEPLTRIHYDDFRRCPGCDAIYWKGSHHQRMERLIGRVRASVASGSGIA